MFCAECRTANLDTARWCTSCGADLLAQRTPPPVTPRPTPDTPQAHESEGESVRPRRLRWAELMARVFRTDVLE